MIRARRVKRRWLLALAIVALVGAAFLLLTRECTVRWAVGKLAARTGGTLAVEGLSGSLYPGPIVIRRLAYSSQTVEVTATGMRIYGLLSPFDLMRKRVLVDKIAIEDVFVELREQVSRRAVSIPRLPVVLSLAKVHIPRMTIAHRGERIDLSRLALSLTANSASIEVALTGLENRWGKAHGVFRVGTREPFPVAARVNVAGQLRRHPYTLGARADGSLSGLELTRIDVDLGEGGRLSAHGSFALGGTREFKCDADFSRFNPAVLGDYPSGSLSGRLTLGGRFYPGWSVHTNLLLEESELIGRPLAGKAEFVARAGRIRDVSVSFELAQSRLALAGGFGQAGDRLSYEVEVEDLTLLRDGLAGRLSASGTLEGTWKHPKLEFLASAMNVALAGGYRASSVEAEGRLDVKPERVLRAILTAKGLKVPHLALETVFLRLSGTSLAHTLEFFVRNEVLDLTGRLEGCLAEAWRWRGSIAALENRGRHGFSASDGALEAMLEGERITIRSFQLRGSRGTMNGEGFLSIPERKFKVHLGADRLQLLSRPDRTLVVSGGCDLEGKPEKITLDGKFRVDEGLIILGKGGGLILSRDITVLGRAESAPRRLLPPLLNVNLSVDLAGNVRVQGRDVDARLGGGLALGASGGRLPTVTGSVRILEGTYSAYGQRLTVERGSIIFSGPADNPSLNILAMRKNQAVESGVQVTGMLRAPEVKLVSRPEVPDTEKLSWMLLGHGIEEAKEHETARVAAAANVLLGTNESARLLSEIRRTTGLEEVGVHMTPEMEPVIVLGKRASSRLYTTYERSATGLVNLVRITYTLTQRWALRAQTGTTSGAGVMYTIDFD